MTSQISHLKVVVVAASVQPKNCYDIGDSYCIISNDYFHDLHQLTDSLLCPMIFKFIIYPCAI